MDINKIDRLLQEYGYDVKEKTELSSRPLDIFNPY